MKHCRKLELKEYSSDEETTNVVQTGRGPESMDTGEPKLPKNSIRAHALNRQRKILTIIRKLARIEGYNDQGHIKGRNGSYLEKSDIATLVLWAVSQDKIIYGLQEFVDLLKAAGVTADEVMNENLRIRLDGMQTSQPKLKETAPVVIQEDPQPTTSEVDTEQQIEESDDVFEEERADDAVREYRQSHPIPRPIEVVKDVAKESMVDRIRTLRPRKQKPYDRQYGRGFDVSDSE